MTGDFAAAKEAHQRQLAEQAEAEREQRIAYLQRNAARRMFQADLLYGWSTWQEQWAEVNRKKRMLAAAGARLARPALAAAMAHWVGDWRAEEHERALASADKATRDLMASAAAERSKLAAELAEVRAELEQVKLTGSSEKARLEEQRKADVAAAEEDHVRQMEEQLEAEREKRIANLQQSAARRIANAGIASGFSTWQEQWEEAARQKRMLAAAVALWVGEWRAAEAEKAAAEAAAQKKKLQDSASSEREELQAEVNALRAQLKAAVQGAAAEKAKLLDDSAQNFATAEAAYAKQLAQQAEAQREKRVAHLQQQAMRRIANAGIASGFSTWQEQWAEAARQKRMLAAAGARLARPALAAALAGWVADWRAAEQALQAEAVRASLLEKDGEQMAVQVS